MKIATGIACISLSLMPLVAVSGSQTPLIGRWQTSVDANGHSAVFEFRPDGTETMSQLEGTTLIPTTLKNGKPLVIKYAVSGDRMTMTYPGHKIDQYLFKIHADKLIFTKVLLFQGHPNRDGQLRGSTLNRFKG